MTNTGTATRVLKDLYGIDAELSGLYGELDDNFLATMANGEKRILKIMHVGCDPQRVDFQCEAMLHLAGTVSASRPCAYETIEWAEFRGKRTDGDYADYGAEVQISQYRL